MVVVTWCVVNFSAQASLERPSARNSVPGMPSLRKRETAANHSLRAAEGDYEETGSITISFSISGPVRPKAIGCLAPASTAES